MLLAILGAILTLARVETETSEACFYAMVTFSASVIFANVTHEGDWRDASQ